MGFVNKAKADTLAKDAHRAAEQGHSVFVARINQGVTASNFASSMSGASEQVEAIEAEGWHLDQMTAFEYKSISGSNVGMVCMFRRGA